MFSVAQLDCKLVFYNFHDQLVTCAANIKLFCITGIAIVSHKWECSDKKNYFLPASTFSRMGMQWQEELLLPSLYHLNQVVPQSGKAKSPLEMDGRFLSTPKIPKNCTKKNLKWFCHFNLICSHIILSCLWSWLNYAAVEYCWYVEINV